jgi:hypothetical protein
VDGKTIGTINSVEIADSLLELNRDIEKMKLEKCKKGD